MKFIINIKLFLIKLQLYNDTNANGNRWCDGHSRTPLLVCMAAGCSPGNIENGK